ncbi:hypothetical protein OAO87_00290 [bacterium]|nr:hypothetical protein [bacterium]
MASPSFRTPQRRTEPKEDGEVGEKIGDLLRRHGQELGGELGSMVKELDDNVGVFSPATMKMVGRMLSAALSPMPHKASPEEALEALETFTSEHLPLRRRAKAKAKALQADADRQAAEALSERILEEIARREALMQRKRALGSPEPMQRKKRNTLGDLVAP